MIKKGESCFGPASIHAGWVSCERVCRCPCRFVFGRRNDSSANSGPPTASGVPSSKNTSKKPTDTAILAIDRPLRAWNRATTFQPRRPAPLRQTPDRRDKSVAVVPRWQKPPSEQAGGMAAGTGTAETSSRRRDFPGTAQSEQMCQLSNPQRFPPKLSRPQPAKPPFSIRPPPVGPNRFPTAKSDWGNN